MAEKSRIYSDTSTIKPEDGKEHIPRNTWHIMVNEKTWCKVSNFYDTKIVMVQPTYVQFEKWRKVNKPVNVVWQDNAGKNKKQKAQSVQAEGKSHI